MVAGGGIRVLKISQREESERTSETAVQIDTNNNEIPTTSMIERAKEIPSTDLLRTTTSTNTSERTVYETIKLGEVTDRIETVHSFSSIEESWADESVSSARATSGRSPSVVRSAMSRSQSAHNSPAPRTQLANTPFLRQSSAPRSQENGRSQSADKSAASRSQKSVYSQPRSTSTAAPNKESAPLQSLRQSFAPRSQKTGRSQSSASRSRKSASSKSVRQLSAPRSQKSGRSLSVNKSSAPRSRKSAPSKSVRQLSAPRTQKSGRSLSVNQSSAPRSRKSVRSQSSAPLSQRSGCSQPRSSSIVVRKKKSASTKSVRQKSAPRSQKSERSLSSAPRSRKSGRSQSSAPRSQKSGRSLSVGKSARSTKSTQDQPDRGRTFVRNRDRFDQVKSNRSATSRSTSIPITKTPNLLEQDVRFTQLKRTPEDNKREWNRRFPSGHTVVYTDGSAKGNTSGFGIYYGPDHELNRSERINQPPHNSSRAEVLAAVHALRNLREWKGYKSEPVILRTDAWMIIKELNGDSGPQWFNASKNECRAELIELKVECDKFPNGVKFEHVHAHAGPDVDPGNEAADDLARQATVGPTRSRSASRDRSGEYGRSKSRSNDPFHIRSHSAHVVGRRRA